MRKIKVFVDAHVFDDTYQGTSTYIKGVYSELVKHPDFEITLAACNIERLKQEFPNPLFHFVELPSHSKLKRLAVDIPKLIKHHGFDYAHFQYITPLKKECQYINTIHDLLFIQYPKYFPLKYRLVNYFTFRLSAIRSDIICTVSEYSKKNLINFFHIKEQNIVLTPNAVDEYTGAFSDVKSKYGVQKYILYVSRFEPRKNHKLVLEAFVQLGLKDKGYKLVFIGRYKDVSNTAYEAYFNSLNEELKASVMYFENLPTSELYSFYKQADLFIYPSLAEGFGIPPLEAAMLNCKVLCSNKTALADFDFFRDNLFDPHNIEELKSKITANLSDENYPFQQTKSAAMKKYNWNTIALNFGNALKQHLSL